jgi:hypothetical protein
MLVWVVFGAAVVLIAVVFYYIYGPGYEKHLAADDPPINPQHPPQTKLALSLVRAYAKSNGKMEDYDKIITTPQGGFDIMIGDWQSFLYDPAAQKITIRTVVDKELDASIAPELERFMGHTVLLGGKPEFKAMDDANALMILHDFTNLEGKKTDFLKQTESYQLAAKNFDVVLMDYLKSKSASAP